MNTHLKIGVIMDTSVDYVSPTLDFMLGQGTNFPVPTNADFANLLFSVLDNLHRRCMLADIIGNHTQKHTCNYSLERAITEKARETKLYPAIVRAKEVYKTYRTDKSGLEPVATESYLYIACTRTDPYWLLVDKVQAKHDEEQRYVFTQLDAGSMAEFFSHYGHYADHIGLHVLRQLVSIVNQRSDDWSDKQRRLHEAAVFLNSTSNLAASACTTPRTSGDGFEG